MGRGGGERGQGHGGGAEDKGAMDAISIPLREGGISFYSDMRGGRFYERERRTDAACTSDVRALGASL